MDSSPAVFVWFNHVFAQAVAALESFLFYPVPIPGTSEGIPFLVTWLLIGGIYFTFRLGFANYLLMGHGIRVIRGKYVHEEGEGQISTPQAVSAVLAGTIGVGGNIAGIAIAVSMGGTGAIAWIMLAGFFCTATKFAEVTIGHKYRRRDEQGNFRGGAWYYLTDGLRDAGYGWLGKPLAILFAICCVGGALGGGNMFQSNQAAAIVSHTYTSFHSLEWVVSLAMAILTAVVLIGGIRRIGRVAEIIVPFMAILYVVAGMVVLLVNYAAIPAALADMFHNAFTPEAAGGALIGSLIIGLRRAFFSNESGIGSSPIIHAASRNIHPVREGSSAIIEPIVDSVIICTITGLVITVTGAHLTGQGVEGVQLTSRAFASAISWFPHVLTVVVLLFAFATLIAWSYYGERAWRYLTGDRYVNLYYIIFCTLTFLGGVTELGAVVTFSDLLILAMAVPNLIGLYLMSGIIKQLVREYRQSLKTASS